MHTFKSFLDEAKHQVSDRLVKKHVPLADLDKTKMELKGTGAYHYRWTGPRKNTDNRHTRKVDATGFSVYKRASKNTVGLKAVKEDVQLDELKSSTLGRYIKTAAGDLKHQSALLKQYKKDYPGNNSPTEQKLVDQKARAVKKRSTGIGQATNRLVNRIYGHSKGKDN